MKISLDAARHYQSPHTGFVHYCYAEEESRETIPIFENICFALALFRTHIAEQVIEGKKILSKLLHFQTELGAFPDYLHEYPLISRPFNNLQLLFPLYQIHLHYSKILGEELREKLTKAIEKLSHYLDSLALRELQIYQKRAFDHVYFGAKRPDPPENLFTEKDFGKALLAAQLLNDEIVIPWDDELSHFMGAPFKQWMKEFQPQLSHLDLLLKDKIDVLDPILIHASLFFPMRIKTHFPKAINSKEFTWHCIKKDNFHLLVLDSYKPGEPLPAGFHLLKLLFGSHTFVCQETKFAIESHHLEDAIQIDFTYPEERPLEKHKQAELNFFLNHQPRIDLLIRGKKATTFNLEDPITFDRFTLSFSLIEGDATLFGHIYRGNRPSQTSPKVKSDYEAFDWKITLRTISRQDHLKVRMTLRYDS